MFRIGLGGFVILFLICLLTKNLGMAIVALLLLSVYVIYNCYYETFSREGQEEMVPPPAETKADAVPKCPAHDDDPDGAPKRIRIWETRVPTELYNAEQGSAFASFCYGHPRRALVSEPPGNVPS